MKKKLLSWILSLTMAFTVVGVNNAVVFAASEDEASDTEQTEILETDSAKAATDIDQEDAEAEAEGMQDQDIQTEDTEALELSGDGTEDSPYLITSAEDFANMSADAGIYYSLENDITVTEPYASEFKGTFDGNGKTVTLDISSSSANTGMFANLNTGAIVKNLTITGSITVTGNKSYTGGLVGAANANGGEILISNVTNKATIDAYTRVGGIVGQSSNGVVTIENCANLADITGTNNFVSGIAGILSSGTQNIINCYNTGDITGFNTTGGIVGQATKSGPTANITNCYNSGTIKGTSANTNIGGLIGTMSTNGSITNCYTLENVASPIASGDDGIVGSNNCSNVTNMLAKSESEMKSPAFAELLGSAYQYNEGGYPVFATGEPAAGPTKYTVAFDLDGGNIDGKTSIEAATVTEGAKVSNPGTPEKDGYTFVGWFAGDEEYDFESAVKADIELKAKYTQNPTEFTVTYDLDGGTLKGESSYSEVVAKDEKASNPGTPEKDGYTFAGWFDGDEEYDFDSAITADLELTAKYAPKSYNVTFDVVDKTTGDAVSGYTLNLTYEEEDYWGDTEEITITPKDGIYTLDPNTEYTYEITCDGYKPLTGTFTPSGDQIKITEEIGIFPVTDDYTKVKNVGEQFEKDYVKGFSRLRPNYDKVKNINDYIKSIVSNYNLDVDGVTVSVSSSSDTDVIANDGTINYLKNSLPVTMAVYLKNLTLKVNFKCGDEEYTTGEVKAQVGWDLDYFKSNMETEASYLNFDAIKGENTSEAEVTSDLTLPQSISTEGSLSGNSMRSLWSEIVWTSSDENVIKIEKPTIDSPIYAATGKVFRDKEDKTVTLTATFKANDTLLNANLGETVDKIGYITKTFEITVPGDSEIEDDSDIIQKNLESNYENLLVNFYDKETKVDPNAVTDNIQMPTPGTLEKDNVNILTDRDNQKVVMTSSDEEHLTFYGYQAQVFRPLPGEDDVTVKYTVSIEDRNDGKTLASQEFSLTIKAFEQKELDDAAAFMKKAVNEDVYWNGIKNENTSKDNVLSNLKAFKEIRLNSDGDIEYYLGKDNNFSGIQVDEFEDYDPMVNDTYRLFRTSNKNVISYENLLVTLADKDTDVTIDSVMSYYRYALYWEKALDAAENGDDTLKTKYADFEQFYKQPVSVTVTVGHDHSATLVHHPATEPSYTNAGNNEYWQCSKCGKKFADENASKEMSDEEVTIPAKALKKSAEITLGKFVYRVTSDNTVSVKKLKSKKYKSATIPATITVAGNKVKVTGIDSKAFKGAKKFKKLTIKTPSLSKARVKNSLKSSKVKYVKVKVSKRGKANRKYVKKYRKYFKKKNSGKYVRVR